MNTQILSLGLVVAAALVVAPARTPAPVALAQEKLEFPQPSPPCTLQQRVGLTDVTVKYCRPSMKGRKIFGGLEPYGSVWRTGANNATTIQFSTDVKFGDTEVPAGTYALFSVPGEKEWTVILNEVPAQWGAYEHDPEKDIARVAVKPVALAAPVETFTIGLADLSESKATFYFEWERVRVPLVLQTNLVATLVPRIEAAMAGKPEDRPYFQAAMFYFENGLDLKKAAEWIDAAVLAQPDAVWIVYRKGLILEKSGDKAGATAAAKRALELAAKANPALKAEYTRLSQALLDRLR
jgi:hypothetical protein